MKISHFYLSILLVSFIYSCAGESNSQADNENEMMEEIDNESTEEVPKKVVYYATPSLIEVANIMKSSGADFSSELLNEPGNSAQYTTHEKIALNLGVYGADLTYSAMFDETQSAIDYLKTIKSMSDELGMDGAFESGLLQSIEDNITDREALLDVISDFFWSADSYLAENDRTEVSSLIITGGWIESMYIACDMAKRNSDNEEIRNRIAEQKLILKNLILFLNTSVSGDQHVEACIIDLKELQVLYSDIEINQGTGNTVTNVENGITVIGNVTEVSMSNSNFDALSSKFKEIRQKFVE